jgi:hypothetical protein
MRVHVRGVVPFAGNPVADPGHADGAGLSARFRRPMGLAVINPAGGYPPFRWVAADPERTPRPRRCGW